MDKQQILTKWLNIEFTSIARKLKFISKENIISYDESLIYESIRCLDKESLIKENVDKNFIITIIGLMWEHIDHDKYDLRKIIIKFLSRIGYPTSAIICDKGFNKETCNFSALDSYIDEITSTLNQMSNEVYVGDKCFLLTDFQKEIWDSINENRIVGISAPTSAGKSFVILLKIAEILKNKNFDILYIVPTLSLLNQVMEDFNIILKSTSVKNYWITNTFEPTEIKGRKNIYIMTQEKAIAALDNFDDAFLKNMILVADEIQNIERIFDDSNQRSRILFDTLLEFRNKENVEKVIISGPRIDDIDKLGEDIFGYKTINHTTTISPVLNLTYSIKKEGKNFYFKQYCAFTDKPLALEIVQGELIKQYGKKRYDPKYMEYFNIFFNNIGKGSQNIIFAPTSDSAVRIACLLNPVTKSCDEDLIRYYKNSVSEKYSLCKTLSNGVAYHHGKLPLHVRRSLEVAIANKQVPNVVCTTTLLQGVNLPAQNIFIRNPHLYINQKSDSVELSNYEMANLRGRAGRLLKDYIGRTYVMEEDAFLLESKQSELFKDDIKELSTSYEEKFEQYRDTISRIMTKEVCVDETMRGYGYLVTYIRQKVLRYEYESLSKLENVGINLNHNDISKVIAGLKKLSIPKEICLKNRYWDPFVLEKIYKDFKLPLPSSPMDRGAGRKLNNVLKWLRDTKETHYMYEKHIPKTYQNGLKKGELISLSIKWSKGQTLFELFQGKMFQNEDATERIDATIELLQNTISFNLPMLLKPIYDILDSKSIFLLCMQSGAIDSIIRKMIEMGIPRETAIYLFKNVISKNIQSEESELSEEKIREIIRENIDMIPYWIKVQLNYIS